jgi:hypothetical protein
MLEFEALCIELSFRQTIALSTITFDENLIYQQQSWSLREYHNKSALYVLLGAKAILDRVKKHHYMNIALYSLSCFG